MERILQFIKSKVFIYVTLLAGITSLLFIGQEKQYGIFAWLAPIFLLHFSRRAKSLQFLYFFFLLILAGLITQKTHNLLNDPVFGVVNGIAYAIINFAIYLSDRLLFVKGKKFLSTLLFPSVYVTIEALISSIIGTSGVLAQSQFSFTPFAHLSTLTGLHGISFIICWFASIVYWFFENEFQSDFLKKGLIRYTVVFVIILGYGFIRMTSQPKTLNSVKVATVSGPFNLHQLAINEKDALMELGKNPGMDIPSSYFSGETDISVQLNHTKKAAESGAKIIVWSEASLFLNEEQVPTLIEAVKNISKTYNAYVLIAFFEKCNSSEKKPINNKSILFSNNGTIGWEYKKSHPTPAEIPLVNAGNSIIPTLDTEYGRVGNVICYDYDFPTLLRQANKNNVDIMLVPAYDWKGYADMHSKIARFETLQSGRLLIRANGNGINVVADNQGIIISELNTFLSNDRILFANLPLSSKKTLYAKTGGLIVNACILFLILWVFTRVYSFIKIKKIRR